MQTMNTEEQGCHLVDGPPTQDERTRYDKLTSLPGGSAGDPLSLE